MSHNGAQPRIGHVGMYTAIIIRMYGVAMRSVFRYEQTHVATYADERPDQRPDLCRRQSVAR